MHVNCIKPNEKAITVFIAGDSMACDQENIPLAGWGQMLPILFKAGEVAVANHASSDRTAQSFIAEKRLDVIGRTRSGILAAAACKSTDGTN